MNLNILHITSEVGDLNKYIEDLDFHLFHLKTENEIYAHEEELEEIRIIHNEESEEYIMKLNEIEIIKGDHDIQNIEDEIDRLIAKLQDGEKYLEKLIEDEYNMLGYKLENFHF